MVGILRSNKREIPAWFKRKQESNSTTFVFDDMSTLVSYCPKENKNVLLLSSKDEFYNTHTDQKTKKPNLVLYYNRNKGAVDTFDQLCSVYTVARKTFQWPLRIFYSILDMAGVNTQILPFLTLTEIERSKGKGESDLPKKIPQRTFLADMGMWLMDLFLRKRHKNKKVRQNLRAALEDILSSEDLDDEEEKYS